MKITSNANNYLGRKSQNKRSIELHPNSLGIILTAIPLSPSRKRSEKCVENDSAILHTNLVNMSCCH